MNSIRKARKELEGLDVGASRLRIALVRGCGWIQKAQCGCVRKHLEWQYADFRSLCEHLIKNAILAYPIKNGGRFDEASKLVALSVALALHDASILYAECKKQDIGILGTSRDGALAANRVYFRDYLECGRKLGRGNLFIYTLPSSPLAEAAIHFGLQGPIVYMQYAEKTEEKLLEQAALMIRNKEAKAMVTVLFNPKEATCHFLSRKGV